MEEEANVPATPDVFRNEDVLREIFKYLPTSTLISSCSLVNKLWREEARSFIRDKRECTVTVGVKISATIDQETNLWEHLCELDRVLGKMDTIPFNSLRILITQSNSRCDEKADRKALRNLMSRFPLKYLSIIEGYGAFVVRRNSRWVPGPVASVILELVQENSSTLLEFESRPDWKWSTNGLFQNWDYWEPPRFEKLKKLSIEKPSSITADCANKIIRGASNLRAILNNSLHMIPDVIPENMYGTLKRLAFGVKDVDRIQKFADKLNQLEELQVNFKNIGDDSAPLIRCITLFHKLLALNSSTLCSLGVLCHVDGTLLSQLQLPLLPSVKVLSICFESCSESLGEIFALNFRGSLPNLYQVQLREVNRYPNFYYGADDVVVPEHDVIVAPNASETTMELTIIDYRVTTRDLATLRSLFPNVIKLSFTSPISLPPLGFAGIMWPNLQSLSVCSQRVREEIVSSQVLGIHPEEWKLLRQQGKQVSKRVQLVPSRPCVLTMRELKLFQLEYPREGYYHRQVQPFRRFLEPILIGRMPGLSFKMKQGSTNPSWNTPRFSHHFDY